MRPKHLNRIETLLECRLQHSTTFVWNSITIEMLQMASVRSTVNISTPLLKDCVSRFPFSQWLPKRKSRFGRPDWDKVRLLKAYLLKIREHILEDTELARKLKDNVTFRYFCDFSKNNIPSHDALSRSFRQITPQWCHFKRDEILKLVYQGFHTNNH